jgi:methylmalonyl-CoA epimerase
METPAPRLELDHVAVAVHSIKEALTLYRDALGGEYLMGADAGDSWRWVQLRYPGGGKVELLEPLGEGFLSRFLAKRGEGLHHMTFKTDDIEAAMRSHGTLIQLAQPSGSDEEAALSLRPSNLEEILGGAQ